MLNQAPRRAIEILLVDDHPIVRFGYIALLRQIDSEIVFVEAENAGEALDAVKRHAPAIAIIDLSLAGTLSLDLIKRIKLMSPDTAILVASMHDERMYAERALRAGARGYVMKQVAAKSIAQAVQCVREGKVWLSEDLRSELVDRIAQAEGTGGSADNFHALSDRELAVFRLIGLGLKKGEIARDLCLSPNTVETYRSNIKQKMGISSGAELYRIAFLHSRDEVSPAR